MARFKRQTAKQSVESNQITNPYSSLPPRAFWAPSVAKKHMNDISDLWQAPFPIRERYRFVTFGSCFAQHFSRALVARGLKWSDCEPAPRGMKADVAQQFNYGVFSARTGNIYTTSLLLQWTKWALEIETAPEIFWEKDGRYYDPFRPVVEPDGFASADEMFVSRQATIAGFRQAILTSHIFVFTLGLTESWWDVDGGFEYPMCPGTIAGDFDPDKHKFINQDYDLVRKSLLKTIRLIRGARENGPRFLLTVSPVPLTASNSGNHVLVATMESKSILRAVAASAERRYNGISYFPSYEIIAAPPFRGTFFEPNLRSVNQAGVDLVMKTFFAGMSHATPSERSPIKPRKAVATTAPTSDDDLKCEEELLAAFGPETSA